MAQYAWAKGWKSAALATDTVIVYFKDVVKAFKARFTQLGGKIVAQESYQSLGSTSQQNVITKLNGAKADVDRDGHGRLVRRAAADRRGPADARQRDAGAQLVGR